MIYKAKDIDIAYDLFLNVFQLLYDKYCPIKKCFRKQGYSECPWLTKGLQKKNAIYRNFN